MSHQKPAESEPIDAELRRVAQQQALARLMAEFEMDRVFEGESRTEEHRNALTECFQFLAALAVGGGTDADWGVMVRMHRTLKGLVDPQRAHAVWLVEQAIGSSDLANRATNLLFFLHPVDVRFQKLSVQEVEQELANKGRRGPAAVAARLSIKCGAFSETGYSEKEAAAHFDQSGRGLRNDATGKAKS